MFLNANSVNFANVNFQGRKLETTRNLTKIAKKNVTITPERKAIIDNNKNIVKLVQKGFSLKEIAEKLKLNLYELYNYSRANRIKQIHFADRNQEIMELYKKGTPVSDIAKKFNLSESFIRGLACFNSQPRRIISKEAILKKLQEGAPISEIIETFNVSKGTIRNISVQTGIIQNKLVNRNIKIINGLLKSTSKEDMASQFVFLDKIYKNSKKLQKKNNSIIRNRNVVQKLREGDSIFSVALKFGLSESSVRALSSQTGAHREAVVAKELRAIEMLRQGKKYKEIAKELGLTESKIKILSSKSSAHSEYLRDRNNKVLELYNKNYTQSEISQELGLDKNTVYNILKKFRA